MTPLLPCSWLLLLLLLQLLCVSPCFAHSQMTQPQSTSPRVCRVGGQPQFGIMNCRGPCDLRPVRARPRWANYWSPDHPAATYRRGQRALIKYARNNHGPGGFIRLSLVPPGRIMHRHTHDRNAFHYSCWGAYPVVAKPWERVRGKFGFSFVGSDGGLHRFAKGYYQVSVTIPTVVPDGDYVLGWAWYGGTGGKLRSSWRPQYPKSMGYFGDYYSCAFVRIRGGPLTRSYAPRFINDMAQFSKIGCMSSTDELGECAREPCIKKAWFRRPKPFSGGKRPPPLTRSLFVERSAKSSRKTSQFWRRTLGACKCLARGRKCRLPLVRDTNWKCRPWTRPTAQPAKCKSMCCGMCKNHRHVRDVCWGQSVRRLCGY